jgi:hypothetical protein
VRTIQHNRQARRTALCIHPRRPDGWPDEAALSRRGLALRAHGSDLAQLAETVAEELELSPDLIDHLLGVTRHP